MMRKGLILAGGEGTRLYPLTRAISKQLLPVYDKPMIYYPLGILMLAGLREVLIITTPRDQAAFEALLGDGSEWGMRIRFAVQPQPGGLAQALVIGRDYLAGAPSCLILGDNLFFGHGLPRQLTAAHTQSQGATVFGYWVRDPERYGVAAFDTEGRMASILEKPVAPPSNWAITGLYFYDGQAPELAASLKPSPRGELEITDLNNLYLQRGLLHLERLGRGTAWLDTGTHESLMQAGQFIQTIEERQGLKICCPEEIAFKQGWIDVTQLRALGQRLANNGYGRYLLELAQWSEVP
ncbi:MAG: glucose-1-phosphate thymidylyltransferase RfbA [Pseudomonadota bacterium]